MGLTREDEDQLRLLSIFHYVVGGMHAVCAMFPLLHLAIGAALGSRRRVGRTGQRPDK